MLSDGVILAIVGGIVTIVTTLGTIWLKGRIDSKLKSIETKIDGRLTELLESTQKLANAEGLAQGKEEGRESQKADVKETKAKEGEIKIETTKVDISTQQVNVGKKPKPDKSIG